MKITTVLAAVEGGACGWAIAQFIRGNTNLGLLGITIALFVGIWYLAFVIQEVKQ